jgi:voltage-gated potassium channel Kch
VVDYNPEVIEQLERQRMNFMYGDATDPELLRELNITKTKLIVSVMVDFPTNLSLLKHVTHENPDAIFICHADTFEEANELYNNGATYIMMPYLIGSEKIGNFLKRTSLNKKDFDNYRDKHLTQLESQLRAAQR